MNLEATLKLHRKADLLFDQPFVEQTVATLATTVESQCKHNFPLLLWVINSYFRNLSSIYPINQKSTATVEVENESQT